jgi:hypothetical protein
MRGNVWSLQLKHIVLADLDVEGVEAYMQVPDQQFELLSCFSIGEWIAMTIRLNRLQKRHDGAANGICLQLDIAEPLGVFLLTRCFAIPGIERCPSLDERTDVVDLGTFQPETGVFREMRHRLSLLLVEEPRGSGFVFLDGYFDRTLGSIEEC